MAVLIEPGYADLADETHDMLVSYPSLCMSL
jgi:hypothetical protein